MEQGRQGKALKPERNKAVVVKKAEMQPLKKKVVWGVDLNVVRVKAWAKATVAARADEKTGKNPYIKKGGAIMPGFDRTGPASAGPMTGGGRGFCAGSIGNVPWYGGGYGFRRDRGSGRSFRRGRAFRMGQGFGRGYGWNPSNIYPNYPVDTYDEIDALKAEARHLENALDTINKRIEKLESASSE